MRYSDWKMISSFGLGVGVLFLIGAILAYLYSEPTWLGLRWYPFRDYVAPLAISGIVLLAVGYVAGVRIIEERRLAEERPTGEVVYCSACGTQNEKDAVFCKKCGQKLS